MFEYLGKFEIYKTCLQVPTTTIEKIYELKEKDTGVPKTNIGGWHSKTFTPYKDYYNGRYLWTKDLIENITLKVNTKWPETQFNKCWFNLSHQGGTNRWHNHGEHPIVGVFYIQVPENSSEIEFKSNNEHYCYFPSAGDLLIFPGKLEHRVLENKSEKDRISLAINFNTFKNT